MHLILGDYKSFLNQIFESLLISDIDVSHYYLDHICYRTSTNNIYKRKKEELSKIADLLLENRIGGRLISKFKLYLPIEHKGRKISIVELPAPKDGIPFQDGLEHIEFVIDSSLEDFIKQYSHISFNMDGYNKGLNADVSISFNRYTVKFHEQSLEEVVKIEKQNSVSVIS